MTDWPKLENLYVTGKCTYAEVAERGGMAERTVRSYGANHQWGKKRREFQRRVADLARERTAEAAADRLATLREATDIAAEKAKTALELMGSDTPPDTQGIRDIARALKDLTQLTRDFYNIPTEMQRETMRLTRERLELDRAKQGAEAGSGIQIVIGDGEWTG